jgi:hypothetical protein
MFEEWVGAAACKVEAENTLLGETSSGTQEHSPRRVTPERLVAVCGLLALD